jgi:hypothetical protein
MEGGGFYSQSGEKVSAQPAVHTSLFILICANALT